MSLITLNIPTARLRRLPKWKNLLAELRQRARSRYELRMLADRDVWDLGLTRTDANFEANKPFWHS